MRPTAPLILAAALVATAGLAGCGGSDDDPDTVKVVYNRSTDNAIRFKDRLLEDVKKQFEKAHPGKKIKLIPIQAADNDYAAKVQQMMRSSKTAPDLVYEDTFRISSDIAAGYLRPLDGYLKSWDSWGQFAPTAKAAGRGEDGRTYGVPDGTDTRGLWFNKQIFARAGLPADWRPKNWDEVLDAARTVKEKVPGVTPINVFTGKAGGETSVMQGLEMLLYGTGQDPLYDPRARKWRAGGAGLRDALGFVRTVYAEKLGPDVSDALNPNANTAVANEWLPDGKLAIALDGSWLGQHWLDTGGHPWPRWSTTLGQAPMPTQHGQPPGRVSMSGGWAWAITAKSDKPDLAWKFIETLQSRDNAVRWDVVNAQIAVRQDVAADRRYRTAMPGIAFFTGLVRYTHYRPATPDYPQVSAALAEAMEAVTTGDSTPAEAADSYGGKLKEIAPGAVLKSR
ncbi:extracellular solute-binding protein [Streptomyces palmae]|uniref:Extracellular solute-binding protein n=1 Tax=Streptomyces palmae TaxID=1701085 RepID=A0A4Z0HH20_9ACTN|nr:extracellular solute-binding protein [Streptomyces palmae]TGB16167.1 extracellular solute-binding protein [Streptomyces palmae]